MLRLLKLRMLRLQLPPLRLRTRKMGSGGRVPMRMHTYILHTCIDLYIYIHGCFQKYGKPPKSSLFDRVFHEINHPFWWFSPYFWKHPHIHAFKVFTWATNKRLFFVQNLKWSLRCVLLFLVFFFLMLFLWLHSFPRLVYPWLRITNM